MHRVVALCLDGLVAFDLTAPAQAFGLGGPARRGAKKRVLQLLAGRRPRSAPPAASGSARAPASGRCGGPTRSSSPPTPGCSIRRRRRHWPRARRRRRGARLLSVCSGAFALAYAGVLDGRRAATHWAWAGSWPRRFPAIEVDPDALYVDEGEVMTSAGLSAGIDLSLHAIRKDFGAAAGERVARHMVAAPHREGGQAQFARPTAAARRLAGADPALGRGAPEEPLDVAAMAATPASAPAPSPAASARRPGRRRCNGCSPSACWRRGGCWSSPTCRSRTVAWRCGFGTAASLRDHFRRATATTPTAYRSAFGKVDELTHL